MLEFGDRRTLNAERKPENVMSSFGTLVVYKHAASCSVEIVQIDVCCRTATEARSF